MAAFEVIALDTATPQLRAPGAADTYTFPRDVEMPLGTANGVLYLNGSKVVTSGSGLTFDGTNLGVGTASPAVYTANSRLLQIDGGANATELKFTNNTTGSAGADGTLFQLNGAAFYLWNLENSFLSFGVNNAEQMRLTSTGLGVGTNNPAYKLDVNGAANTSTSGYYSAGVNVLSSDGSSIYLKTGTRLYIQNGSTTIAQLTNDGNLGLGVTPSAWGGAFRALQFEGGSGVHANTVAQDFNVINQAYNNGSGYVYQNSSQPAARYQQYQGAHAWYTAPSGTAGNAISFTQALTLDANRNLLLNGTAAPASGVGTFAIFNGTAPTGSVTDGCVLYTEDVSSSSELKVRDEAGNVTTLSPHNFELIPEGPSEDMAWSYYSERDGKRINVDMLKAIRLLEKLSGEQLVYKA